LDFYHTIESPVREEIKIKGSRFIASVAPVIQKEDAEEFISTIRKEFYDATHNCFAYKIGESGAIYRSSDDGEPSGSAGKPILFSIQKSGFSDIVVVVTRFYGGTKLGIGPLARAYSESANVALEKCVSKKIDLTKLVKVYCIYEDINVIKRLLSEYAVSIEEYYTDSIEIEAQIPLSLVDEFKDKLVATTNARAGVVISE